MRVDFLQAHVYLFDTWARDRVNRIALHMQPKRFTPAQKCMHQGQEPEGLLFLFRGSVKVFRSPVTYMSIAETTLRERMGHGGTWVAFHLMQHVMLVGACLLPCHVFPGPFLTAVPDGDCAPPDGSRLPALHKLRTQASVRLCVRPFFNCFHNATGGKGVVGCL